MANQDDWTPSAHINGIGGSTLVALFWTWGSLGLIYNTVSFFGLTGSIGVGTSAYLTVGMLYWIGGMVFFGLGALCNRSSYSFNQPND